MDKKAKAILQQRFEALMGEFDFDKVLTVMQCLKLEWSLPEGKYIPTKHQMFNHVNKLFNQALQYIKNSNREIINSGGFEVEITQKGSVFIRFIAESVGFCKDDDWVL